MRQPKQLSGKEVGDVHAGYAAPKGYLPDAPDAWTPRARGAQGHARRARRRRKRRAWRTRELQSLVLMPRRARQHGVKHGTPKAAWPTFCAPLPKGMPSLAEAQRDKASETVVVLGPWLGLALVLLALLAAPALTLTLEGAKVKDGIGRLPLHDAAANKASDAVVQALLAAHPEGAKAKGDDGWLPLHFALQNTTSDAVVLALLAEYPLASLRKDGKALLPLDIALESGASREVLAALAQAQLKVLAVLADATQHIDLPVGAPPQR